MKHFGSLKKLRAASLEEIAQVPGIGPRTAEAIKTAVSAPDQAGDDAPTMMSVNTATGEIIEETRDPA